jgi:hypothetical protein
MTSRHVALSGILLLMAVSGTNAALIPITEGLVFTCLDQTGNPITNSSCENPSDSVIAGTATEASTLTAPGSSLNFSASGAGEYGNLHAGVSTNLSIAGYNADQCFRRRGESF